MVDVNLISWNIENYGPSKFIRYAGANGGFVQTPNYANLIEFLTATINSTGANMLSVLELKHSIAPNWTQFLKWELNDGPQGPWEVSLQRSRKQDTYLLIYRTDEDFAPLVDVNGRPVQGLCMTDAQNNPISFPSPARATGGRRAAWFAFTTGAEFFTVLTYHANYSRFFSGQGLAVLASARQLSTIDFDPDGNGVQPFNIAGTIVAGDFNVDSGLEPEAYNPFINAHWAVPPAGDQLAGSSDTSLKDYPDEDWDQPVQCRSRAYDNIFSNMAMRNGNVLDAVNVLIDENPLSELTELPWDLTVMRRTVGQIGMRPPISVVDAWRFYRGLISNHLPVFATIAIAPPQGKQGGGQ